jgi:hypothetical protein
MATTAPPSNDYWVNVILARHRCKVGATAEETMINPRGNRSFLEQVLAGV